MNQKLRVFPLIRFGDVNLDGFKDMLINVMEGEKSKLLIL